MTPASRSRIDAVERVVADAWLRSPIDGATTRDVAVALDAAGLLSPASPTAITGARQALALLGGVDVEATDRPGLTYLIGLCTGVLGQLVGAAADLAPVLPESARECGVRLRPDAAAAPVAPGPTAWPGDRFALSLAQVEGMSCVRCGVGLGVAPSRAVGLVDGVEVYECSPACRSHERAALVDPTDPDADDAAAGPDRCENCGVSAATHWHVPGMWVCDRCGPYSGVLVPEQRDRRAGAA